MESNSDYLDKAMGMFTGKRTAKIVTPEQVSATEWSEQLRFCKRLKNEYPGILYRSDIQSAGKLSPQMQNIKAIIDPYSGWPDISIYHSSGGYCGLLLEMKRIGSGYRLKSGELSSDPHVQAQAAMHIKLRKLGYRVEFVEGEDEAWKVFLEYINL